MWTCKVQLSAYMMCLTLEVNVEKQASTYIWGTRALTERTRDKWQFIAIEETASGHPFAQFGKDTVRRKFSEKSTMPNYIESFWNMESNDLKFTVELKDFFRPSVTRVWQDLQCINCAVTKVKDFVKIFRNWFWCLSIFLLQIAF